MKLQQHGFSHIIVIALVALVVGVAGFAGYKVVQGNKSTQPLASANKTSSQAHTSTKTSANLNTASKEQTESTSDATSPAPAPSPAPTTAKSTSTTKTTTPTAPAEKRTISFTKGGGAQQGTVVHISANLSESQQGTCTYTFSLDGSVRVTQTSAVSNGNQCAIDVPVSAFPKSATYSFALKFVSSDGLVSATQSAYDIDVN